MINNSADKIIMMSGGGTGGSVTPLLAIAEELQKEASVDKTNLEKKWTSKLRFVFVGTKKGPEKEMIIAFNQEVGPMEFTYLISGKWRRYFSIYNFIDIFKISAAFFQAFILLTKIHPNIVISAGAFVSVPLVWAAKIKKIPVLIHQQDLRPGLANKLMVPGARAITVVFEKSLLDYGPRAVLAGNPISQLPDFQVDKLLNKFKTEYSLDNSIPLILCFGGGLGAAGINRLVFKAAPKLTLNYQIIHLTGRGKLPPELDLLKLKNYLVLEHLNNRVLSALLARANLVISRAGLGTLTELSYWRKPAILIPLPHSQQEENATYFAQAKAALFLDQKELTPDKLTTAIENILADPILNSELSHNIGRIMRRNAADTIAGVIWEIIGGRI